MTRPFSVSVLPLVFACRAQHESEFTCNAIYSTTIRKLSFHEVNNNQATQDSVHRTMATVRKYGRDGGRMPGPSLGHRLHD